MKISKVFYDTTPEFCHLFNSNPCLDSLVFDISEINGKRAPVLITVYERHDGNGSNDAEENMYLEKLNLDFEGDHYYFKWKYGQSIPILPEGEVHSIISLRECSNPYKLHVAVSPDSIAYRFMQYCLPNNKTALHWMDFLLEGKYKSGNEILEKKIESRYLTMQHGRIADSVLVLQGVLNGDGSLREIELVIGMEGSPWSNAVMEVLRESGADKSWTPSVFHSRPTSTNIKFYVRLNSDGSTTFRKSAGGDIYKKGPCVNKQIRGK